MNIPFDEILKRIETADDDEIEKIMNAVRKRFAVAFPDWEVIYLSCPRQDEQARRQTLDFLISRIQSTEGT